MQNYGVIFQKQEAIQSTYISMLFLVCMCSKHAPNFSEAESPSQMALIIISYFPFPLLKPNPFLQAKYPSVSFLIYHSVFLIKSKKRSSFFFPCQVCILNFSLKTCYPVSIPRRDEQKILGVYAKSMCFQQINPRPECHPAAQRQQTAAKSGNSNTGK